MHELVAHAFRCVDVCFLVIYLPTHYIKRVPRKTHIFCFIIYIYCQLLIKVSLIRIKELNHQYLSVCKAFNIRLSGEGKRESKTRVQAGDSGGTRGLPHGSRSTSKFHNTSASVFTTHIDEHFFFCKPIAMHLKLHKKISM